MTQSPNAALFMHLPQKLLDAVDEYAYKHDTSRSACIRTAIAAYISYTHVEENREPTEITLAERKRRRAAKQRKYQADYRERQKATT